MLLFYQYCSVIKKGLYLVIAGSIIRNIMYYKFYYYKGIGWISILSDREYILRIVFGKCRSQWFETAEEMETPVIKRAYLQILEFLSGSRYEFDLPVQVKGTDFQKKVWRILQEIPYGETWSYKQVAERLGNPHAVRAVGMANNRNPIPIVIPCHRVIGVNGDLVGYAGGIEIKKRLLDLEKNNRKQQ